mmetsp:Transcript_41538/g.119874  ORF Transcript_41538/g.119874 Transcript_41538/m.119874 type:complete len:243 (-) Transcript_41538:918-1646(-)
MLDRRAQVLERKRSAAHDDHPLAPEAKMPQLVGIAVANVSAEVFLICEGDVPALADATVHRHEDGSRHHAPDVSGLHVSGRDEPSVVSLLLGLEDLPTTPNLAVGVLSANGVDVPHDVVPRGVVLVRPRGGALLVHDAVTHLGGVDARVDVGVVLPNPSNRIRLLQNQGVHALLREVPGTADPRDAGADDQYLALLRQRPICWPDVRQHARVVDVLVDPVRFRNLLDLAQQGLRRNSREAVA